MSECKYSSFYGVWKKSISKTVPACSCFRAKCKVCFVKWVGRHANRATYRIETYQRQNRRDKPIHLFFSVPRYLYRKSYNEMKQELRKILKQASIVGDAVVFHPF